MIRAGMDIRTVKYIFVTSGHPIDFERRNRGLEYAYPITDDDRRRDWNR